MFCVCYCYRPLDEGKKVKERFDDIFDATKQNKYLEHIRLKKKAITDRKLACRILVSRNGGYEEFYFERCNAVQSGQGDLMFWRNVLHLSLGPKRKPSKKLELCLLPVSCWFLAWLTLHPWGRR
jgi:hypothetical protein